MLSPKRPTDSKWCDEVEEHRLAKRKRWNAVNANRVFDTNDPQLDRDPTRWYPTAGQFDELWARWR